MKTNAIERIEEKISNLDPGTLRYEILNCAKNFKSSWIDLGQYLYALYKNKEYTDWGYSEFQFYCSKEIGIRKETALKLMRSYRFLEEQEPGYLKKEYLESVESGKMPSYESIDILRQVKNNKDLGIAEYNKIKKHVFVKGTGEKEVRDVYRSMRQEMQEQQPEEVRRKRRMACLRRMVTSLNSIKKEINANKFLSEDIAEELDKIVTRIEVEIK